jgi:polyphosphate kinase 2 (PPK2 family)
MALYDEVVGATSTQWAPWHVVPADHKWVRDVAVAGLLVHALEQLDPRHPEPAPGLDGIVVE